MLVSVGLSFGANFPGEEFFSLLYRERGMWLEEGKETWWPVFWELNKGKGIKKVSLQCKTIISCMLTHTWPCYWYVW